MKARLALFLVAVAAVLGVAGCGGGGGSGSDPATLAPPGAPVFLEATIRPEGQLKENVERLFARVTGIDTSLSALIVSKAEEAAGDSGEALDFEKEVEPWLGDRAGLFLESYDGEDFHGYGVAIAVTDTGAAEAFVHKRARSEGGQSFEAGSYEGVEYEVDGSDGTVAGVIGDFLAIAEDPKSFKAMVDASKGESLADQDSFSSAVDAAPGDGLAEVFVDVGGLIEESGGKIDPEAKQFLDTVGVDPDEATAVASLVPGSEGIEIDVSSDLSGENPPSGDASKLLGALPADSVAAVASADFGERFGEAVDRIDRQGIPGQIPPHELKKTMQAAGIDLEKISASVGDAAVFVEGDSKSNLGGAVVLEAKDTGEARNTVSNVGLLLRAAGTPGVTSIGGKISGFSVRSPELGRQPLIVGSAGDRITVAYGLPAAARALATEDSRTLADSPAYKQAVSALGGTPISGFVAGPDALKLASALVPAGEERFREAKPYLAKIEYVAIGAGGSGDRSTAKLIVGVGE